MTNSNLPLNQVQGFFIDNYQVNPSRLNIIRGDKLVSLEPKSMQLLVYLATHAGQVISRQELEENIWQGRIVGEDALTNNISKLRRAFDDNARHPKIIATVPKTGYRLVAEVEWQSQDGNHTTGKLPASMRPRQFHHLISLRIIFLVILIFIVTAIYVMNKQPTPDNNVQQNTMASKPAIAILPFQNLDRNPENNYFADGITTSLITDLSKISGILIIAPGSVFPYRDHLYAIQQISRDLNVGYVLKGSVQRQGQNLRVNAQLINTENEQALWAERYESDISDIFHLQDKIASTVVNTLKIKLSNIEQQSFSHYPTRNVQAYDYFLRGLEQYGHRTRDSNQRAGEYFIQAIKLDPAFARAVAGLALVYSREAIDGWTTTPQKAMNLAAKYANQAYDINPGIPQVQFVMGQVALFNRQHEQAIAATKKAILQSPNYADAYALLAWILNYAGQHQAALSALDTAKQLNPVTPASYVEILGEIQFLKGDFIAAIKSFKQALQINPAHMRARMWLIASLVQTGDNDELQWEVTEFMLMNPGFTIMSLQHSFPFLKTSEHEKMIASLSNSGLPK